MTTLTIIKLLFVLYICTKIINSEGQYIIYLFLDILYFWIILDCKLNQYASKLRVIRTVRGLVTWDDCREHCIDVENCSYFKFKVAFIFQWHFLLNDLTTQDHQNVNRRKCTLIQMVMKIKKGWVSGPKFYGRDGRYYQLSHVF